jgi:hypothetical protein
MVSTVPAQITPRDRWFGERVRTGVRPAEIDLDAGRQVPSETRTPVSGSKKWRRLTSTWSSSRSRSRACVARSAFVVTGRDCDRIQPQGPSSRHSKQRRPPWVWAWRMDAGNQAPGASHFRALQPGVRRRGRGRRLRSSTTTCPPAYHRGTPVVRSATWRFGSRRRTSRRSSDEASPSLTTTARRSFHAFCISV